MKKLIFTLAIFIATVLSVSAQLTITVTGTVTGLGTSLPVANHAVNIMIIDSNSSGGFTFFNTVNTNSSGQYSFTVAGYPANTLITLSTVNCQNQTIYQYVTAAPFVSNFSICTTVINPPCVSSFNSYQDSVNLKKFYFSNTSTGNPTSYLWNFGDNTTSTVQNPIHTYVNAGYYMVSLTISGNGCQSVSYDTVYAGTASNPCVADFTSTISTSNSLQVHFANTSSTGMTNWMWNFGDNTTSTLQNPSHIYSQSGTYNVTLTASNNSSPSCSSTITKVVVVANAIGCQSSFTIYPDSTTPNTYIFNNTSTGNPTSYLWSFGDGTSSTLQHPNHTYTQSGTFIVTLTINGSACQSSSSQTIIISGGSQSYNLSGSVFAGNNTLDYGNVILFNIQNTTVSTTQVDSMGHFYFSNLPASTYYIYAVPSTASMYYTNFVPTYYTNSVAWSTATPVVLSASSYNKNISLVALVPTSGGGTINGNLNTPSKGVVSNAVVNLYNSSNAIVKTTTSNASGQFLFSNIAYGTYKIWVEIPGKTPASIEVNLSEANPNSSSNNFIVGSTSITVAPTSINESSNELVSKVYPNPVTSDFTLEFNLNAKTDVKIEIFNSVGQLIKAENRVGIQGTQKQTIDVKDLSNGTFYIKISTTAGEQFNKMMIKM